MSEEVKEPLQDAMVNKHSSFHGNPLLKSAREPVALTKEHLIELKKCADDPVYFAENYMKIVNVDKGLMQIQLYPYQKRILQGLKDNRMNIILSCRQSGKCVTYDTLITVRHPKYNGGNQFSIKIGDFYLWMKFKEWFTSVEKSNNCILS